MADKSIAGDSEESGKALQAAAIEEARSLFAARLAELKSCFDDLAEDDVQAEAEEVAHEVGQLHGFVIGIDTDEDDSIDFWIYHRR